MGPWSPHLWNGSWLPSILCRSAYSDLWEDCVWEGNSCDWIFLHGCVFPACSFWMGWLYGWIHKILLNWFYKTNSLLFLGAISIPLQLWFEGSVEKPVAGGSDKTLWQPEEWSQWHQGPQMVCHNRLDRNLREKGKTPVHICNNKHCQCHTANLILIC